MSDDLQTADSSPAPADPGNLDALTSDQLSQWRTSGMAFPTPDAPKTEPAPSPDSSDEPTPADSAPAVPDSQAASTEATPPPASEPGKPPKKNADSRKEELRRDIESMLAERAALKAELEADRARLQTRPPGPDVTAASSPAPDRSLPETIQSPDIDRPPLTEEAFFASFPGATVGEFARYAARYEILTDRRMTDAAQVKVGRAKAFEARIAEAITTDPDFWAKQDRRLAEARPVDTLRPDEPVTPWNVLAQEILVADNPVGLIQHLSAHRAEIDALLAERTPVALARRLGRLEASLTTTASPPAPAGNPVSLAPVPPLTLGSKPATKPVDELEEAVRVGDVATYIRIANAREIAARKVANR